ncbi:MAG: helix-turn-helix domain-containing protein [bacterium]
MTAFTTRKIIRNASLGDKLKEARNDRGVPLEKVAKDLNIAYKYLEALENDKFTELPGAMYLKKFLQDYCAYLNLKFADLWPLVRHVDFGGDKKVGNLDQKHFRIWPRYIGKALLLLILALVFVFLGFKIKQIFTPPDLQIFSPSDGLVSYESQVNVSGQSEPEADVVINNKDIFVDSQGKFSAQVDLQKGLNLIKITAKKRYSQESVAQSRILYKDNSSSD